MLRSITVGSFQVENYCEDLDQGFTFVKLHAYFNSCFAFCYIYVPQK